MFQIDLSRLKPKKSKTFISFQMFNGNSDNFSLKLYQQKKTNFYQRRIVRWLVTNWNYPRYRLSRGMNGIVLVFTRQSQTLFSFLNFATVFSCQFKTITEILLLFLLLRFEKKRVECNGLVVKLQCMLSKSAIKIKIWVSLRCSVSLE